MKKRGQITLFMIIGIVILLTVVYIYYIKKGILEEPKQIQPELVPVQDYVESCIKSLSKQAITTLGINGGYIYFPTYLANNPLSYLSTSIMDEFKNPYWWYSGIENIPTKEFMEDQIAQYLHEHISTCLNDFEAFADVYDIIEHGEIETFARIGKKNVVVNMHYPIEVKDKFNRTLAEIDNFKVNHHVRLNDVYEFAKKIIAQENQEGFIEKKTMDLLAMNPDIPDTGGPVIQCGKMRWYLPDVEEKIKQLLWENLPFIKILNTDYSADRYVPIPDGVPGNQTFRNSYYWHHYRWAIGNENHPNMRVSFSYDSNWPFELYVRPNDGLWLESNSLNGQQVLSFLCMHIWHFTYDMKFPVLVTILDQETLQNEEFTFRFPFMASIDHNTPRRESFAMQSYEQQNFIEDEQYCNDLYYEIEIRARENTLSATEINGVNLTLICGRFKCNIGMTELDYDIAGTPRFVGLTPYCVQAILRGNKQGYNQGQMFIQTDIEGRRYDLYMDPIKEFSNITVVKHKILNDMVYPAEQLAADEQALITIKEPNKKFEEFLVYPLNESILDNETQKLKLLAQDDYTYQMEIYLYDNESITGAYKADWELSRHNLNTAKGFNFHVIGIDDPDDDKLFELLANLESDSQRLPSIGLK